MNNKTIIVAGCTRSGLTLMMQILYKGGYPCFGSYPAFEDYEIGKIDYGEAEGKAIKLVDSHLQFPPKGEYYVIRMKRDLIQQSISTIKLLNAFGFNESYKKKRSYMRSIAKSYIKIDKWVKKQEKYIVIEFEDLLKTPEDVINKINEAFDINLDVKAKDCVVKRTSECYDGMLEVKLIKQAEFKPGVFMMGRCSIIVTIDDGLWHLSISTPNASPSYKEIKEARYKFLPDDIFVGQIFPPKKYFVNLNSYCHHLWQVEEKYHYHG